MSRIPKSKHFASICRTCLGTESLIPIFDDKSDASYYSSIIFIVSGVKVEKEDGLPQKMCATCMEIITHSLQFRRQSQSCDMILKIENSNNIKTVQSDTNIITHSPADDLSEDETLIKYVNKHKLNKSLQNTNNFENITKSKNSNDNCLIKIETGIDNKNKQTKHTTEMNNKITNKTKIKIEFKHDIEHKVHKDVEINLIRVKNCHEIGHETNKRMFNNHNETKTNNNIRHTYYDKETEEINKVYHYDNDTGPKHNNLGIHYNKIGYSDTGTYLSDSIFDHNDTETWHKDSIFDQNEPGINNETRNNHNDTETWHKDSIFGQNEPGNNNETRNNHKDTETWHKDSIFDQNEPGNNNETRNNHKDTETWHKDSIFDHYEPGTIHNETRNNHKDTETWHKDSIFDHNEPGTNDNETRNNHNTEICHNVSEYNHTNTKHNNNDKIHNHNETKTINNIIVHNKNNITFVTINKKPNNMKNKRVPCKICYKDLSHRSLDVHMSKYHPGLDERKAKCEFCACYVMKNRMKTHMNVHGDSFNCAYCMKEQTDIETLRLHSESCSQRKKKRSGNHSAKELKECDICNKKMQKGSLRLHKQLKHAGLGPICEHCGKKLSNKFRLSEHLRAKHGYEKHKCGLCGFQTAFKVHLKNHERRHRGERPFVCEVCGSKYYSQNQLIQHRYTHNNNKDFKCDQCQSSFRTTVNLSVHKKTAHSSTPMCCSVCTRYFRCRHYLVKHVRNVHRVTGPVLLENSAN